MNYRQNRQNTIPVPTRQDEEIQTDVNLVSRSPTRTHNELIHASKFFEFCAQQNVLRPFSDHFLLSQFNGLLQKLRTQTANLSEPQSQKLIFQLSGKVHGLLTRQLRLSGEQSDYYKLISDKQKQVIALQIKNSYKDKYIDTAISDYQQKIANLQRQIANLRYTLGKYQSVEEENTCYRGLFNSIKDLAYQNKDQSQFIQLIEKQVKPLLRNHEIDLGELSKGLAKDRTNKLKGTIQRYARELNQLANSSTLKWEALSQSAAAFFTSLEHMKQDNWIKTRLNLSEQYQQLSKRHTATLSLIERVLVDLRISHPSLQALGQFQRLLKQQSQFGFTTIISNGWIGLGTIHCHRNSSHLDGTQQISKYRTILASFQTEIKKIIDKYPQLRKQLETNLVAFIDSQFIGGMVDGNFEGRALSIIQKEQQILRVDNVYNYYSKSDKNLIFNLRILIKALLDKLEWARCEKGISFELDQGILAMLKQNILDGVNIDDIIALYRPGARICEVERIVTQPQFITQEYEKFIPIEVTTLVPMKNIIHTPVQVIKEIAVREQVNRFIYIDNPVPVPSSTKEVPILVPELIPTPIYQNFIRQQTCPEIMQKNIYITETNQLVKTQIEQVLVETTQIVEKQIPFQITNQVIKEVKVEVPTPVPEKIQYAKIIEVPTNIPVFVEKPIYQFVQKKVPIILKREIPTYVPYKEVVVERVQVPVSVDRIVEKRVDIINHCDCQKPDIKEIKIQVPVIREQPKEILVEKAHFVKGDEIEKLVEVEIVKQVPFIHEILKQVQFCVQKLAIREIVEEKMIIVEKEKPIEMIKHVPVEILVEKPVYITKEIIKEVKVQTPVPVIIEKQICKPVEYRYETIVEKIVEVPRVEVVQKIVEKIVPVPRIVEKVVIVPQIIEKIVALERPYLEIVQVQREVPVIEKVYQKEEVEVVREVLKIERQTEVIQIKGDTVQLHTVIREPVQVETIKQKIVEVIREVQREREIEIPVPLIHRIVQTIPVQVVREKPVIMDREVPIVEQIPIFYKQPETIVQDSVLEVEHIVSVIKEEVQVVEVEKPFVIYEEVPVQVPSEPIIQIEKELELVYVESTKIQTIEKIKSEPHYLYANKIVPVSNQEFVQPQKVIEYLNRPQEIKVQRMVPAEHSQQIPIEFPTVRFKDVRTVIENPNIERLDKPILKVAYEEKEAEVIKVEVEKPYVERIQVPVEIRTEVLKIDEVETQRYLDKNIIIEGLRQVIREGQTHPQYIQKIVQKIVMIPQVVEVQKKIFMIQEVNNLIAKEVNAQIYKEQYMCEVQKLKQKVDVLLRRLKQSRNKADIEVITQFQAFYRLLNNVDAMPKIVEVEKQVEKEVIKQKPVLVPVHDHEQEIALQTIISRLVEGISKFKKEDIENNFDSEILDIFFVELGRIKPYETLQKCMKVIIDQENTEARQSQQVQDFIQSNWKKFNSEYDGSEPQTQALIHLSEAYKKFSSGYNSRKDDYSTLKASMMKHQMEHYCKLEQTDRLNVFYIQLIRQLWDQVADLKRKVSTDEFERDRISSEYASVIRSIKATAENKEGKVISSTEIESAIMHNATSSMIREEQSSGGSKLWEYSTERMEKRVVHEEQIIYQKERRISEMLIQISRYQQKMFEDQKQINHLRGENDLLRDDFQHLKHLSSTSEEKHHEVRNQVKTQWQNRVKDIENSYSSEINRLREQLDSIRNSQSVSNSQMMASNRRFEDQLASLKRDHEKEIKEMANNIHTLENEKRKIIADFQRKMGQASNDQIRDLRKELDLHKQKNQNAQHQYERQRETTVNEYQRKISTIKDSYEKELQSLKTRLNRIDQQSTQINKLNTQIRQLESENQNMRRASTSESASKDAQILRLKNDIQKLQAELVSSRKEIDLMKKSNVGKTTQGSQLKGSTYQREFQSPESGIVRTKSPKVESEISNLEEQGYESQISRESYGTRSHYRAKYVEETRTRKMEETEQIKSSSSRLSARSGGSGSGSSVIFKINMTMREFMDIKKIDDKDNIMTLVMIKVIEKMLEESEKGILNSYTPNNIFFSNFNPNNIDSLKVGFGAPITNRKSKIDGLYLAPEIHQGHPTTLKSMVFTLGVIWDEMIHYESYFKTINEIENLGYQFKVRDSKMNPILKNTLFQMMSKDSEKRLDILQAKRRLSLQRYITSEGRPRRS